MKRFFIFAAAALTLCAGALDIAVNSLRTNALKEASVKDSVVTGIPAPGCSIDFLFKGHNVDTAGYNKAVLTLAPAEGGVMPRPGDFLFNLRSSGFKISSNTFGAAGEKPGEVVFMLDNVPDKSILIRLYPDYRQMHKNKKIAFKIIGLRLEKVENTEFRVPIIQGYSTINNCTASSIACDVFYGIPQNEGASVIVYPVTPLIRKQKFSKIEVDLTVLEGEIITRGLSMNPRKDKFQSEAYAVEKSKGKYVFEFKKGFDGVDRFFMYFNRKNVITKKPVKFRIDSFRLFP